MYKYLFGPVPSRRLGMSLGVDLVPKKVCSLNCVYCEVGKTTKLSTKRMEYVPYNKIIEELRHFFENSPNPDYITFSGSGEPTLNSRLGDVIKFIKDVKPGIPVAVLTNGTLLSDKEVQEELLNAELVLPSLDAATQTAFNKINRPESSLDIERIIEGLVEFSQVFKGKIWLEIFKLPGYNNDDKELIEFKKAIDRINPDSIQLNTLDRPGTERNIIPASISELERIKSIWGLDNVEIIAKAPPKKTEQSYRTDPLDAILGTISRRPCTIDDLSEILGMPIVEISKYLRILEAENKIEQVSQERGVFYKAVL